MLLGSLVRTVFGARLDAEQRWLASALQTVRVDAVIAAEVGRAGGGGHGRRAHAGGSRR